MATHSSILGLSWWPSSKESACNAGDTRDVGLIPGWGRSPGGGHGNPLQYSCLENPTDRGVWRATLHGVTKSRTRLSDGTMSLKHLSQRPGHHHSTGQTTVLPLVLLFSVTFPFETASPMRVETGYIGFFLQQPQCLAHTTCSTPSEQMKKL